MCKMYRVLAILLSMLMLASVSAFAVQDTRANERRSSSAFTYNGNEGEASCESGISASEASTVFNHGPEILRTVIDAWYVLVPGGESTKVSNSRENSANRVSVPCEYPSCYSVYAISGHYVNGSQVSTQSSAYTS